MSPLSPARFLRAHLQEKFLSQQSGKTSLLTRVSTVGWRGDKRFMTQHNATKSIFADYSASTTSLRPHKQRGTAICVTHRMFLYFSYFIFLITSYFVANPPSPFRKFQLRFVILKPTGRILIVCLPRTHTPSPGKV